jgi:small-conductance mechanosensitive channel
VAGVALFAQWSILSNITASVILFFSFPFKIGSKIEIMDDKNSVTGIVEDITFFVIQIRTTNGNMVSYPNNLAIQKGIIAFTGKETAS